MKKHVIQDFMSYFFITVIATNGTILCQFFSVQNDCKVARQIAGHEWVGNSTARNKFLLIYDKECEDSNRNQPPRRNGPITFKECLNQLAQLNANNVELTVEEAESLGTALETASNSVRVPLPLRWL